MIQAIELVFHAPPQQSTHMHTPKVLSTVFTAGRPLVDVMICLEMKQNFPHMSAEPVLAMFWKQQLGGIGEMRMRGPHEELKSLRQR